jgi:hypothetical protein
MANPAAQKAVALQQHLQPVPGRGPASQATHIEQSRAVAEVQAMVVVAKHTPRSEASALNKILESCGQMRLAEKAFFKFPRGGQTVSGSSIHLACELARCWGNVDYGVKELDRNDDDGMSEMMAFAWDLETNTRAETTFIVPHKRDKKGGAEALTDMRDIYENNANNAARRLREMIFRVIPPYIKSQAEDACRTTLERGDSEVPIAQRIAATLKAFAEIGISRERIEAKAGMSADALTPVDLANLRVSYQSIKRQEVTAEEEFPTVTAHALAAELGGGKAEAPKQESRPADPKAPSVTVAHISAPMHEGAPDWKAWHGLAMNAVPLLDSPAAIDAWMSAHAAELDGIGRAKKAWRVEIEQAAEARKAEIGGA